MTQINTTTSPAPTPAPGIREPDSADRLMWDMARTAGLPDGQRKAILSLLYGNSPQMAAHAAGVHRGTLYRWMRDDPAFRGALAEARLALYADAREQMAGLIGQCVELMHEAVFKGDAQMAYRLLRSTGVLDQQAFAARKQEAEEAMKRRAVAPSGEQPDVAEPRATSADLSREGISPQEQGKP